MGVVYKARDTLLGRTVALKVLPPELVNDPDRKRRFVREAKAASSLNHPNIVTVHDIVGDEGVDFIVMEYVAGQTLAEILASRRLALDDALKYAVQIASALAAAHGAGVVHRDLKPGNIMVDGQGVVKVVDFGLAKLAARKVLGELSDAHATQTDTAVGQKKGRFWEQSPTCPPSRLKENRWMAGLTFSALGPCCTSSSLATGHFRPIRHWQF